MRRTSFVIDLHGSAHEGEEAARHVVRRTDGGASLGGSDGRQRYGADDRTGVPDHALHLGYRNAGDEADDVMSRRELEGAEHFLGDLRHDGKARDVAGIEHLLIGRANGDPRVESGKACGGFGIAR